MIREVKDAACHIVGHRTETLGAEDALINLFHLTAKVPKEKVT